MKSLKPHTVPAHWHFFKLRYEQKMPNWHNGSYKCCYLWHWIAYLSAFIMFVPHYFTCYDMWSFYCPWTSILSMVVLFIPVQKKLGIAIPAKVQNLTPKLTCMTCLSPVNIVFCKAKNEGMYDIYFVFKTVCQTSPIFRAFQSWLYRRSAMSNMPDKKCHTWLKIIRFKLRLIRILDMSDVPPIQQAAKDSFGHRCRCDYGQGSSLGPAVLLCQMSSHHRGAGTSRR